MQGYVERRNRLITASGQFGAKALSDLTDEAVSTLAGAASAQLDAPFAIFALGGYGARRLLPHSDIDLLVVTQAPHERTQDFVRALLYPLWDAGLTVGHQVRSPAEQARAVAGDVEVLASFLTARLVAGDRPLADRTVKLAFARIAKRAPQTLRAFEARERPGSPYLLEPDLKAGAGGQRDLDEIVWRAAIEAGAPQEDCLGLHLLEGAECVRLDRAQSVISAARWHVHRASARPTNLLTLDVAEGLDAAELQRALEVVHHTLLAVRDRAAGHVFAPVRPTDAEALVRSAEDGPDLLERLAHARLLDDVVPGFASLMTVRRPALSHRYTVGAHLVRTLVEAVRDPGFAQLDRRSRDALAVAALAHDVGKRETGAGHADRSAAETPAIAARLGLSPAAAGQAAVLVREHLLLSEVATTRDLGDEDVVLSAAARLGSEALVQPLLQLTSADMRATGPDAWTPWRAALVEELADKMRAALAPDVDGAGIVPTAEATRADALRDASAVGAPRSVLRFIENAPLRYLARRTSDQVLHDARRVQSLGGPGSGAEIEIAVRPGPLQGTWRVDVVTRDRAGLFASASGALALVGLDALSAEAFTDRTGIALDTFTVTSATLAPAEPSTWSAFERALHVALRDPSALDTRLAERLRHYPPRPEAAAMRPQIEITHFGPFTAGVRVRAADRVGLLHDLARTIERAGLDIRRATISTEGTRADDTFEIADADGQMPERRALVGRLIPALRKVART